MDGRYGAPAGLGTGGGLAAMATGPRPPLSPREGWISDGRQVLHFQPARWDRWRQTIDLTCGELIPGEPAPLLKHRREIGREQAIRIWQHLRQQGWHPCPPQWSPPPRDFSHPREWAAAPWKSTGSSANPVG
ncbi:MAG: DUF1651 domain-containing protein [Cyanobacteriota bacterium]|nr:DUF1651 domain-containing protein [Cyanobacteriota bacterium]